MKVLLNRLSISWFIKKTNGKRRKKTHVQSDYECLNGQI